MGIIFVNELNFWALTKFIRQTKFMRTNKCFVNDGVVQKEKRWKNNMDRSV